MPRQLHAIFECSLGRVGVVAKSDTELQKQFNWFCKRYQNCKITEIKEINDGSTKEKLHKT